MGPFAKYVSSLDEGRPKAGGLTGDVGRAEREDPSEARRADGTRSQADGEQEAQADLLAQFGLETEKHGDGQGEDPQVGDEVGDVGEVTESHQVEAGPRGGPPEGLDGPAGEPQDHLDREEPQDDEGAGGQDQQPVRPGGEDAVVERKYRELGAGNGQVVEMAKDVVSLAPIST